MARNQLYLARLASILILCCAGIWLTGHLVELHDTSPNLASPSKSLLTGLCGSNTDGTSGCEINAQSHWSEIPMPFAPPNDALPVAFLAMAYFICILVWFTFVGLFRLGRGGSSKLPVGLVSVGFYASLFFIAIMALGRAPWCGICVAVHVVNFLLVALVWIDYWRPVAMSDTDDHSKDRGFPYKVATVALAIIALLYINRQRMVRLRDQIDELAARKNIVDSLQANPAFLVQTFLAQPQHDIPTRADQPSTKPAHKLIIFMDYECPACYRNEQIVRYEIKKDFGDSLLVESREFPLCKDCNSHVPTTLHPSACQAAYAAEAARLLGGETAWVQMGELLYEHRLTLAATDYSSLAIQIGLDAKTFATAMQSQAVQDTVRQDIELGHSLNVANTPTMFLDGRRVPLVCLTPGFWKAIAAGPPFPAVGEIH